MAHTSHPASHVLRPRKLVPRLTSKATTTTTDGGDGGTTGGGAGSSTLNTMMSAACKIQYVSGEGQHSAAMSRLVRRALHRKRKRWVDGNIMSIM
jgi:hypothetical protein